MTVISRQQALPMGQLGQEVHQLLASPRGVPGTGWHHQVEVSSLKGDPPEEMCPIPIPRSDLCPLADFPKERQEHRAQAL